MELLSLNFIEFVIWSVAMRWMTLEMFNIYNAQSSISFIYTNKFNIYCVQYQIPIKLQFDVQIVSLDLDFFRFLTVDSAIQIPIVKHEQWRRSTCTTAQQMHTSTIKIVNLSINKKNKKIAANCIQYNEKTSKNTNVRNKYFVQILLNCYCYDNCWKNKNNVDMYMIAFCYCACVFIYCSMTVCFITSKQVGE
jgi:hypothetical protein